MKVKDHIKDITKIRAVERIDHGFMWAIYIDLTVKGLDYHDWYDHIRSHDQVEMIMGRWEIPPEMFWEMVE